MNFRGCVYLIAWPSLLSSRHIACLDVYNAHRYIVSMPNRTLTSAMHGRATQYTLGTFANNSLRRFIVPGMITFTSIHQSPQPPWNPRMLGLRVPARQLTCLYLPKEMQWLQEQSLMNRLLTMSCLVCRCESVRFNLSSKTNGRDNLPASAYSFSLSSDGGR
ncbi:hypothetical protein DM02DRAFT_31911 [Periconia macrospinosa]|uniref:Secreted protein n=1 Tax=Periconia macrospinosa TaxID=97972 RepID=A0A2V1DL11_9PLEO|nr:hypothetical protein DM02DRAFT_31911 [Periconia macrospinosa]